MTFITAFTLLITSACGFSPLLNHTLPNRAPETGAIHAEDSLGCRFEFSQGLCADFIWMKEPRGSDEGSMKIYFWSKEQPGVFTLPTDFQVGVKLWMPDMGHGSQKVKVVQIGNGVFDATEVMFVMPGVWEIQLQLKDAAGKVLEMQKVPYLAQ